MNESPFNPCAACAIQQDCCTRLSGLRLTEAEFDRCFAVHRHLLDIQREGSIIVVSPKNGAACPNWQEGGCAVYDIRPRECQLFPFTLFVRKAGTETVSIGFHSDTHCPQKAALLAPVPVAHSLVVAFGQEAFPAARVQVKIESPLERFSRRCKQWLRARLSAIRHLIRRV